MPCQLLSADMLPHIFATFQAAFADYYVDMPFTEATFADFLAENGVQYTLSVGAYVDGALVGILLNAVDEWHGAKTAYDSGTGVVPEHRGKKIAGDMLKFGLPPLRDQGVSQYLLEVIEQNEAAHRVYQQLGFQVSRMLDCFQRPTISEIALNKRIPSLIIREISEPDWALQQSWWGWHPAWQNGVGNLRRTWKTARMLGAFIGGECIGYLVFYPAKGRIAQFVVAPRHRQAGVGSQLLQACRNQVAANRPLSIINVDRSATASIAFLAHHGFEKTISQYEMILDLS